MNINDIFNEADEVIKKASSQKKTVEKTASVNDEVTDLAQAVLKGKFDMTAPQGTEKIAESQMTPMEKIAHSMAIVDTLLNLSSLAKLEKIAQVAQEQGYSPNQINQYIEKKASEIELVSVAALIKDNFDGMESEKTASINKFIGKKLGK